MGILSVLSVALLAVGATAQTGHFVDAPTGIEFYGNFNDAFGIRYGYSLPQNASQDFVGNIVFPLTSGAGWAGMSLGNGMLNHLLIAAWPQGKGVASSFRLATSYKSPPVWKGNATMKPIAKGTYTNATHLSFTFLCSGCLPGAPLTFNPTDGQTGLGWCYGRANPTTPSDPATEFSYHDGGYGGFALVLANARTSKYDSFASQASSANI